MGRFGARDVLLDVENCTDAGVLVDGYQESLRLCGVGLAGIKRQVLLALLQIDVVNFFSQV